MASLREIGENFALVLSLYDGKLNYRFPNILISFLSVYSITQNDDRAGGSGGAGGAIAPPIIFEIRKKVAISTPNFLDCRHNMS